MFNTSAAFCAPAGYSGLLLFLPLQKIFATSPALLRLYSRKALTQKSEKRGYMKMKNIKLATIALTLALAFTACGKAPVKTEELPEARSGIIHSTNIESPSVGEITSFGSVTNWVAYAYPVAGSELTVEYNLSQEANEALLNEINTQSGTEVIDDLEGIKMYLVKADTSRNYDLSRALAVYDGGLCTHFTDPDTYETEYVVRYGNQYLPSDLATDTYTLVFAHGDGTIDSYMDIYVISSTAEADGMNIAHDYIA